MNEIGITNGIRDNGLVIDLKQLKQLLTSLNRFYKL